MMSFRIDNLSNLSIPASTAWLLSEISESKGRQEVYIRQSPQLLKALREMALVQSVESSNRIEGVEVAHDRLRPLVLGDAKPKDRPEAEIKGYREALNLIHSQASSLDLTPALIQRLHKMIQPKSGDAGQWKRINNEIVEIRPGVAPVVRFRPLSAKETPAAMDELCMVHRHATDQTKLPPLISDSLLILDFLCIHPFRDGNGRVSRLLALLLLYHRGFEVGRYISLERLVEEAKEDYYEVLRQSSQRWHQGKHPWQHWVNFHLGIIHRASRAFEDRAGQVKAPRGAKGSLVQDAIRNTIGTFTVGELERQCPGVSRDLIRRMLWTMQKEGQVRCVGRGPGAKWERV
jgi:Fic family protein